MTLAVERVSIMDPLSAVAASIITSIRIFEVTYQLKAVDEQTADLLSTARHVDTNLNETRRLRRTKVALLDAGELAWIDGVIEDTDKALRAVAQLIEPARVDKNVKEGINFKHRIMWVFRDNPKVRDKHTGLTLCHQSLMTVIASLYSKNLVIIEATAGPEKEEKPPPYDPQTEDLFNWRNRRRRRKSSMDLRDADTERPIPTSSVSTNSISTRASPSSPLSFTTSLSDWSSTTEWFEGTISSLAEAQMKQTSNLLATLQDDPPERQVLVSSTSPGSVITGPLSSAVNLNDVDTERPLPASWGSSRRKPVPYNPRLSDTNDFNPSDRLRATQESPYNLPTRPLPSPQPPQSILDRKPEYFSSIGSFPVLDCSSRAGTSSVTYMNQSQTQGSAHTNCLNADTVTMPSLAETGSDPSAIVTDYAPYDNARWLKDKKVYKPYRRPTMGQESQSFTATSTASSSLLPSDVASPSERSHSADQSPAYNPPRFPGDPRYSSSAFVAELESAFSESATGDRELESNGADHDMDKEALPSQTERSTSAGLGCARRGRRSWLMFHARRSDLGRYMG